MLLEEGDFHFESMAGFSEAGSDRSPFCTTSRRGVDRRWGLRTSFHNKAARRAGFPHQTQMDERGFASEEAMLLEEGDCFHS